MKSESMNHKNMKGAFSQTEENGAFEETSNNSLNKDSLSCEEEKTSSTKEGKLDLTVSLSLYRKLHNKAKAEGISLGDLASELLAEGLVLRAWEIMERKSAMKVGSSVPAANARPGRQNYNRNNSNSNSNSNNHSRGRYRSTGSQAQGKRPKFSSQDMGDNANFIEYVRSQEKKNSW